MKAEEIIKKAWNEAVELAEQYMREYISNIDDPDAVKKFKEDFEGIGDLVDTNDIIRHNWLVGEGYFKDNYDEDYEIECCGDYDSDDPRIYIGMANSEETLIFSDWLERAAEAAKAAE